MHLKQKLVDKLNHWLDKLFTKIFGSIADDIPEVSPGGGNGSSTPDSAPATPPASSDEDEVPYSDLDFCWGGFKKNSKAKIAARIKSLSIKSSGMSYSWKSGGCENLGASNKSDAGATLACLFCKIDGKWRGGKFDWISTSRTSRSFGNIRGGYCGWDKEAIEKASAYAFVIASYKGDTRTNVITYSPRFGVMSEATNAILSILKDISAWFFPTVEERKRKKAEIEGKIEEAEFNQAEAIHEGRVTDAAAYGKEIAKLTRQLKHIGWFSCAVLAFVISAAGCASKPESAYGQPVVIGERLFILQPNTNAEVPELIPPARKWYLIDDVGLCQWLGIPPGKD